jgi:hypothetical protein
VIECTTSATLTLVTSFGVMAIDTVNLEAHNGATNHTSNTGGVLLNYTNASGTF